LRRNTRHSSSGAELQCREDFDDQSDGDNEQPRDRRELRPEEQEHDRAGHDPDRVATVKNIKARRLTG
jgi:hypothetical protein